MSADDAARPGPAGSPGPVAGASGPGGASSTAGAGTTPRAAAQEPAVVPGQPSTTAGAPEPGTSSTASPCATEQARQRTQVRSAVGHDHTSHDHAGHDHARGAARWRLAVALVVTLGVGLAELVVAQLAGSVALLADAGHMATDCAGLVIALLAARLAARPATDRSTWGLRRAEVLGAALQAGMLALVGLLVAVRAVTNLATGVVVAGEGMTLMGVVGLAANVVSMLVLAGGRGESLNARAAFLEVLGDALGSVAVLVAGTVVQLTGWMAADPVASLLIVALIVPRAVSLLRAAGRILMELTPSGLELASVRAHLAGLEGVREVHDLHVWMLDSSLPVLTAHVVVEEECLAPGRHEALLDAMQACVAEHFALRIEHATFQLEPAAHREHEAACCA